jgi:subtilisin family serine protease
VLSLGIRNETSWNELSTEINKGYEQISAIIKYNLNLEYDSRSIVGDNYEDGTERFYGNADVKGPDASHGTHVAGIIAANRLNSIGILGVAAPVKIMAVRCVPAGDERDKDVANGIRYAVDNGAKIINMSFGKSYSYNKDLVDDAVRYAESKGVLLIHAAGNSHQNNDVKDNFPNDNLGKELDASNWIEVGAISWKRGKEMIAKFSNYGKNEVDVFAPGVDINSCKVDGGYIELSGTSMAAPVCAGVAALIWIYHPEFTPDQVKSIIETASDKSMIKKKVILPGEKKKKVKFGSLCKSGGVVDLYAAFQFADKKK